MINIFLIIVFLAITAVPSFSANLTECGYLDQPNTTYVLQNDVSSNGSCFFIIAANVTLDLNGYTATYDNATPTVVSNGNFDTSGGWDLSGAPNAAITPGTYIKPVTLYSGSHSLRIAVPNADQVVQSTVPIQLQPNTTYSLSAMVYNQVSDAATTFVGIAGTATKATKTGKTWRGFQYIATTFTTTATPDSITIEAGINTASTGGSGFVYIDDIRVQRTNLAGVAVGPAAWQGQAVISDVTQFGNAGYATIMNGTIQQGQGKADWSNAIRVLENSGDGWSIHDTTLRADGANSKVIYSKNGVNASIYNNHIYNPQWAITSRDAFDGAAIKIELPGYGNQIYSNVIHEAIQTGVRIVQTAGQTQNKVFGNTIEVQSRYTNDFAIYAVGAEVSGNTINCGSGNNACRGIASGGSGTLVYDNVVSVQTLSRNQEYDGCSGGGAYGIQIESTTNNLSMYGNTVTANAGECDAYALRANLYAEGGTGGVNNAVYNNTFISTTTSTERAGTIRFSKLVGSDLNIYNNTFRTNKLWFFVDGGGPITDAVFTDNRWETTGAIPDPFYPFAVYTWSNTHFTGNFTGNTYGTGDKIRFESEFFRDFINWTKDPLSLMIVDGIPTSDIVAPVTTSNKAPGRYTTTQTVALSANETATIKYCLIPGCTPTTTYAAPFKALQNIAVQTVRYLSVDTADNTETVKEVVLRKQRRK